MPRKAKAKDAVLDVSGVWYNPENPGWGVFVNNFGPDTHSVSIYTYNEQGGYLWMVGASNRSTTDFLLGAPTGTGVFDNLRNVAQREAGSISFEIVDDTEMKYKATLKSEVLYPGPVFSPRPPATMTFEGVLKKLGS